MSSLGAPPAVQAFHSSVISHMGNGMQHRDASPAAFANAAPGAYGGNVGGAYATMGTAGAYGGSSMGAYSGNPGQVPDNGSMQMQAMMVGGAGGVPYPHSMPPGMLPPPHSVPKEESPNMLLPTTLPSHSVGMDQQQQSLQAQAMSPQHAPQQHGGPGSMHPAYAMPMPHSMPMGAAHGQPMAMQVKPASLSPSPPPQQQQAADRGRSGPNKKARAKGSSPGSNGG